MNLKDYCGKAAEVLRSSERMVQRNVEIWKQTPETDGDFYDPEWDVHLEQDEIKGLLLNLADAANIFDILSQNSDAAADLLKAHLSADGEAS
ncbi:hypothetical protein [Shimia sediminis]|uniref:hypothetical protein n=1 Tax=Shimia sediminis TaxID=2497945 RepID=UPI000F8E01DE|nr:hypothetical protein [Shimia sediminis]